MEYVLGSTSSLKRAAMLAVLQRFDPSAVLYTVKAVSGVPEQPVGEEETLRGARHRAAEAHARYPQCVAIGVENGIRHVNGRWEDWAVIVLRPVNGAEERVVHSRAVSFPTEAVDEARRRGFATTTVGSVLAEQYGTSGDDPHL